MAARLSAYRQGSDQNIMAELQRRGLVRSPVSPPPGEEEPEEPTSSSYTLRPNKATVEMSDPPGGVPPSALNSPLMGVPKDAIFAEMVKRGLLPDGLEHQSEDPKIGEINPKDDDNDRGFLNTTIGNIVPSGKAAIEGALSLFTPAGLLRTGQALGRAGIGAVEAVQGKETENTKIAGMLFQEATRMFRDPVGTIQNDPVGAMLDVAGILTGGSTMVARAGIGGARVAKAAKTLAKIESNINPVIIAGRMGAKVAKKTAQYGSAAARRSVAVASGMGLAPINIATDAGKAGGWLFKEGKDPTKAQALMEALVGDKDSVKLAERVQEGADEVRRMQMLKYDEGLATLAFKNAEKPIDIRGVRQKIYQDLEGEGIKVDMVEAGTPINADKLPVDVQEIRFFQEHGEKSTGVRLDFRKSKFSESAHEQKDLMEILGAYARWTDDTIMGSHVKDQAIKNMTGKVPGQKYANIDRVKLNVFQNAIANEMKDKVKGFSKINEDYHDASMVLASVERSLGIRPKTYTDPMARYGETGQVPQISETTLTKLGNTLNTRGANNLNIRRTLVHEIEAGLNRSALVDAGVKNAALLSPEDVARLAREKGVSANLMESLAGLKFSLDEVPGIARAKSPIGLGTILGGGIGAVTTGGTGAIIGGAAANWIGGMTIRNPRAVGRFFVGLGAASADMAEVVKHLERLKAKIPVNEVNVTRTIGAALERARQRKETTPEDQQLFQKLGLVKLPAKKN